MAARERRHSLLHVGRWPSARATRRKGEGTAWRGRAFPFGPKGTRRPDACMPTLIYPDVSWSGRFHRAMRTLQVVAIAGTVGAVGGGIGVLTLMGVPDASSIHASAVWQAGPQQPVSMAQPQTAPALVPAASALPAPVRAASASPSPPSDAAATALTRVGQTTTKTLYDRA